MNITKEDAIVGVIDFESSILEYDTQDEALLKVLQWATVNPVPLAQGSVDQEQGVAQTNIVYVPLGNELYPEALEEFLAGYGFEVKWP